MIGLIHFIVKQKRNKNIRADRFPKPRRACCYQRILSFLFSSQGRWCAVHTQNLRHPKCLHERSLRLKAVEKLHATTWQACFEAEQVFNKHCVVQSAHCVPQLKRTKSKKHANHSPPHKDTRELCLTVISRTWTCFACVPPNPGSCNKTLSLSSGPSSLWNHKKAILCDSKIRSISFRCT